MLAKTGTDTQAKLGIETLVQAPAPIIIQGTITAHAIGTKVDHRHIPRQFGGDTTLRGQWHTQRVAG